MAIDLQNLPPGVLKKVRFAMGQARLNSPPGMKTIQRKRNGAPDPNQAQAQVMPQVRAGLPGFGPNELAMALAQQRFDATAGQTELEPSQLDYTAMPDQNQMSAQVVPQNADIPTLNQVQAQNVPDLGPGFAGAALAKKKFDMLVAQAEANKALQLGNIGNQYVAATRNLEGNLEGRGILKSGEGMRNRIALGAEEKAARAAVDQQTQDLINQYGLEYAYQLAAAQAAAGAGEEPLLPPLPPPPAVPSVPGGPSVPSIPGAPSAPGGPGGPGSPGGPGTAPGLIPLPTVDGRPVRPGDTPSETRGVDPTIIPLPTVGGRPVRPGDTPSETVGVAPRPTPLPTVGGRPVRPGDTPSETRRKPKPKPEPKPEPKPAAPKPSVGGTPVRPGDTPSETRGGAPAPKPAPKPPAPKPKPKPPVSGGGPTVRYR